MARYRKLATICAAIALPFGLAACGGGGSGDDAGTPPTPPPTYTVALPDGHGLNAGTTMLPHGDTVIGGTTLSCPNTAGCQLTVSKDSVTGVWTATATGGAVTVAVAPPPPPPPGPDPVKLAEARDGARDAWRAARAALAGIAGKQSANMAAYQLAMDAVDDAKAAYDAALAAETVAEAERQQENAEAANETAQAQVAAVIASFDAPAINDARMAAMAAAAAAKKAYEDAKAALDAVKDIQAMDQASYDTAAAQVAAAKTAYDAAQAAADAAKGATLKADALAQRDAAQDASGDASTANTDAMKYAGMVQAAEDSALTTAKSDAKSAYDAAKSAYDTAAGRVTSLEEVNEDGRAKKDDDVDGNYFRAKDALDRTKAAYDKAAAANALAQAATSSSVARGHADDVETHQGDVDTEKADVEMYALLVETAYNTAQNKRNTDEQNRLAEEQRVKDVAAARTEAMKSVTAANTAATMAEAAADEAEETASGTPGAVATRAAATAARMAATDAQAAHDAITDGMTKAQADEKAADAATAAGTANNQYLAAKTQNDAIQTADAIAKEQQRVAGIAAATKAAGKAVAAAKTAMEEAAADATAAETARDNAQDAYKLAMAARTDATNAKAEYEKAKTAAAAAREAADDAETAYKAAKAAADGIDADGTVAAAETAQGTAETESDKAVTAANTADGHKKTAVTAGSDATDYANLHSIGLLKDANAYDVEKAADKTAEILSIGTAIATAANASDGNQRGNTTATASWLGDTPDNPATADNDESVTRNFSLAVAPGGGDALPFRLKAVADDPDTTDTDESAPQTAMEIAGLGAFKGYEIWEAADATASTIEGGRVIAFTDKVKGADQKFTVAAVAARSVVGHTITTASELAKVTSTATTITGVEWTPDGDSVPLKGTLSCETGCSITLGSNGAVTAIAGYKFTGSRAAVKAVEAADAAEDTSYLLFGLWLNEADDGTDSFGSFAVGGAAVSNVADTIKGTATYKGKAAGVKSTATAADFFSADATLNADFGTEAQAGTISGRIHNIVTDGVAESGVIHLHRANLNGAFAGTTRMGTGKVGTDGNTTYPFNGTWSGQLYNTPANDPDTTADESTTVAPGSAAGTFGVTMPDDADTANVNERTSYVGAFGAHKQ